MARKIPTRKEAIQISGLLVLIVFLVSSQITYAQALAYVANFGSSNVSVINTTSNSVIATVDVGSQPNGIAITPDETRAYVTNGGGAVWVLATAGNTVLAKVSVGGYPTAVAITPDGTRAYVTRTNSNDVSVIDTASNTVTATIPVGIAPGGIAVTPDGAHVYVTNVGTMAGGSVSVIATSSNSVVATINLGNVGPLGVAITPDGSHAYVVDGLGNVSVIATSSNTVSDTVTIPQVGSCPFAIAITPDGTHVYVASFSSNAVVVIGTASNAVVATVTVQGFPQGVAITPDGRHAYVTTSPTETGIGNGSVTIIDTASNTVTGTVGVQSNPYGLAFKSGAASGYVCTNTTPPVISSIDSASAYGAYPYFSSGSWLEIKGTNLADPSDPRLTASTNPGQWTTSDFTGSNAPTVLDGISVSINGKPAYVWYLSTGQLNVQAPEDSATGNVSITATNCNASSSSVSFARHASAPGFLAPSNYTANGTQYAVATFQSDGAYVLNTATGASFGLTSRPAKPGDGIVLYGIGFGDVTPSILPGVIAAASNTLVNPVTISFGSANAAIAYQGLAGGFVGLYEFYVTVPSGLANGDYQLNVTQNKVSVPQTIYLTVHN
jgi:uncharacterized protein (TIGR03437 family)